MIDHETTTEPSLLIAVAIFAAMALGPILIVGVAPIVLTVGVLTMNPWIFAGGIVSLVGGSVLAAQFS